MTDMCSNIEAEDEGRGERVESKKPEDVGDQLQVEQKEEASDDDEMSAQSKVEDVMESTPQQSASVVKYNVKTTPYLQR